MNMVRAFVREENGVVAVIFALLLPILLGGIALGVETGMWLMHRSKLQNIADSAAYSAAIRYSAGATQSQALATANAVAVSSGFDTGLGTVILSLSGSDRLTTTLTRSQGRLFTAFFLDQDFTISASATAQFTMGSAPQVVTCIQTRATTSIDAFDMAPQSQLALPNNCEIQVNSSNARAFSMLGGTSLMGSCLKVNGGARLNGTQTFANCAFSQINTGVTYPDPFADLTEPVAFGTCRAAAIGSAGGVTTLTPTQTHPSGQNVMRFCNGLLLTGQVIFNPGLYIIETSAMQASSAGATVSTPNGATFYFRNGAAPNFTDSFQGTLTPSTGGPWKDVLIFGTRGIGGQATYKFGGDDLSGIIYAPAAAAVFAAGTNNGCFQLIANSVDFQNSARVAINCAGSAFVPGGGAGTGEAGGTPGVVTLVQ